MPIRHVRFLLQALLVVAIPIALGCGDKPASPVKNEPPKDNPPQPGTPKSEPPKADPAKSDPKTNPGTPPKPEADDLLNAKPDFTLKVEETPDTLSGKEVRNQFVSKYGGKIVDVIGPLADYALFAQTPAGEDCVSLRVGSGAHDFLCRDLPVPKAMPGQTITLRGRCDAKTGFGLMTLVRVEGAPPPAITAEELAKAVKDGKQDGVKKVERKFLIVTGTIQKVEQDVGTKVYLTTPGMKPEVTCFFSKKASEEAERHGWLKAGQMVRVLGEWSSGDPHLSQCVVIPPEK